MESLTALDKQSMGETRLAMTLILMIGISVFLAIQERWQHEHKSPTATDQAFGNRVKSMEMHLRAIP
jgi:hypothetical protein